MVKEGGTSYVFVTDGSEAPLERAREAAGLKDVQVLSGANVARQFLNRGLLDKIHMHLVPIFLGRGTRLFDGISPDVRLVPKDVRSASTVTHLVYEVQHRGTRQTASMS